MPLNDVSKLEIEYVLNGLPDAIIDQLNNTPIFLTKFLKPESTPPLVEITVVEIIKATRLTSQ